MDYEQIQIAKIKKEPILFKGVFPNIITWQEVIDHFNYAIQQPNQAVRDNIHSTVGQAHFWDHYTWTLDNAHLQYPGVTDILKVLDPLLDNNFKTAFAIISLTTVESGIGRHSDQYDVFYLQGMGSVDWHLEVGMEEIVYTLNHGDLLFIPANTTHQVKSNSPRAAISMMFNTQQ
jgi:ribosomal protein L16 Arg81 hydroxylase